MPTLRAVTSLDRMSHKRADAAWLAAEAISPLSRTLVLAGLKAAIVSNAAQTQSSMRWFTAAEIAALGLGSLQRNFLGRDTGGAPHFALAIAETDAQAALGPIVDLRTLMTQGQLPPEELSIIGAARALSEWHGNCRHCGHCGAPTTIMDGGWRCKCSACAKDFFPRTDPVVIMLVTHGDKCLISHEPRFKDFAKRMFSTLAGFLEPGEDIEHAVRREVMEEVGLEVGEVRYQESQPWPFPHSLMLGAVAEAKSMALKLDPAEIEEARWIGREELAAALAGRHPEGITLPGKHAIAYKLLMAFSQT